MSAYAMSCNDDAAQWDPPKLHIESSTLDLLESEAFFVAFSAFTLLARSLISLRERTRTVRLNGTPTKDLTYGRQRTGERSRGQPP